MGYSDGEHFREITKIVPGQWLRKKEKKGFRAKRSNKGRNSMAGGAFLNELDHFFVMISLS